MFNALLGYNSKYKKNTELFKEQLHGIHTNMQKRGIYNPSLGKAITSIIDVLDIFPCPKVKDTKSQQAVDEYISSLIQKLNVSAQQKNFAKAVLQARMINDLVNDSRSNGRFARSIDDLKAAEILNDCLGELNQVGEEKENINIRMKEILRECKRLQEMGLAPQITPLKNEYMQLESKLGAIGRKENELSKTYQYNCEAIANTEDRDFYKNLGAGNFMAMRPENLGKVLNEISSNIEINNSRVESGMDLLGEFKSNYNANAGQLSSSSSFEANFEQMMAGDTMNNINSANFVPGQSQEAQVDDFESKFKNFNG